MTDDLGAILAVEYRPHYDLFDALTHAERTRRFSDGRIIADVIGKDAYEDACLAAQGTPQRIATDDERARIARMEERVMFRTEDDATPVASYLAQHPQYIATIEDALENVPRFFDAPSLVLTSSRDPDCGYVELHLTIQTSCPWEDAFARRDRMDHEWLFNSIGFRDAHITIDTETI